MAAMAILMFSCSKERYITEPGNLVPKTVTEDPAIPSITVNGVKLHSEAFGHPDSTLVVFLHGGPGGDYRALLHGKELASHGYRVVFYDQRGSGLSQRLPKSSYTSAGIGALDIMYDELSGVIAHYRTKPNQKVYLVGRSWGAILATGYAAKYPNRVQGLVVAEPGGLNWDDIKEYTKATRSFSLWGEFLNDAAYLDQFISGKEDQHEILDYKFAMLSAQNNISGEDNTAAESFWRLGGTINKAMFEVADKYKLDFSAGIGNFHTPVLLLYSEKNAAYPASWAQRIAASYYNITISMVRATAHSGIFADDKAWSQTTMPRILNYFATL
jgi:proline iminopeptidase